MDRENPCLTRAEFEGFLQKENRNGDEPVRRWQRICGGAFAFCFREEDGNSLIEFTLTLPILMAVLTAIFQLGIAFNNQLELTQGVGAAGQYLQVRRGSTTDPCQDAMTTITNASPMLNSSNITLTLTMNGNSPVSGSSCAGDQSELASQAPVTVNATYPCSISVYGFNFSPTCKLTAQVTEYEY